MSNELIYNIIRENIKNRGVETIDLQVELTDHISLAVDEKMKQGLAFKEAFKQVMVTFGPFGMEKLQAHKYSILAKRGRKLVANQFIKFFTIPKIILTILIYSSLYFVYNYNFHLNFIWQTIPLLLLVSTLVHLIHLKNVSKGKRFTQLVANERVLSLLYYILYVPGFLLFRGIFLTNVYIFTFYLTFIIILFLAFNIVMKKSYVEVMNRYVNLGYI